MAIYFQHVGAAGAQRDFPKTIGSSANGLVRFGIDDFPELQAELTQHSTFLTQHAPNGFQVWGIPSGARNVLRNLRRGDWLLLLESDVPGGQFYYGGRVLFRPEREHYEVSRRLWGEERFPIVVFLDGRLTSFSWQQFRAAFGFAENWRLAGNTYRLTEERIATSPYGSEETALLAILGEQASARDEFAVMLDQVELVLESYEGRQQLREHVARERDPALIAAFKRSLRSLRCEACGFDFETFYGRLGRGFIEAHHIEPIGGRVSESRTSSRDFIALCSNCHRMCHRRSPPLSLEELRASIISFGTN